MGEPLLLLVALLGAGAVVLAPLRRPREERATDDAAAAAIRHRVALEALRDVETDRRAGSLDDAAYEAQRAEDDADRARAAFERFLELAPDDPRAGMIRGLLDEVTADG